MTDPGGLQPGDVLVISSHSRLMRWLSYAMWWRYRKSRTWRWNHVAVMHHTDEAGIPWAIEAKPGGVGWRNAATITDFIDNRDQPKTPAQRGEVCSISLALIKTQYDWNAIEQNAMHALEAEVDVRWDMPWDGAEPPAQVICSSLEAYSYAKVGLAGPHSWLSTPPDWARFIQSKGWGS